MKLLTVVGARPQFIKAAVVSRCIEQSPGLEQIVVHTGQHYDKNMSEVFFREMDIAQPKFNLVVGSGPHGQQTGRMMESLEKVVAMERPDVVLVYGDTNSTLAGALVAAKLQIPVAHVEAGLRSFDRRMPEEINRVLTDHVADLLIAPTRTAEANLAAEGIARERVTNSGDVMFDAALYYGARAEHESRILDDLDLTAKHYILCTVHRAENTDDPATLRALCDGLLAVSQEHRIVLPLHPRTRVAIQANGIDLSGARNLSVIDPVGYLDMVMLERQAALILTDSGGVQKEAYFHGVGCVVLRSTTEWVELVDMGWASLCPVTSPTAVVEGVSEGLALAGGQGSPFGTGHSGTLIVQTLLERFG